MANLKPKTRNTGATVAPPKENNLIGKEELFERMSIPKAVAKLAVPTVIASIVMVVYSLCDTLFVGMLNDPLETSAVTLAAPVILAFNAITNLFGTGTSTLMSRALGVKDYDTVRASASFGLYCAFLCALLFSVFGTVFRPQLLNLLGADSSNSALTSKYLFWTVTCGAIPSILNVVLSNCIRSEGSSIHASVGVMSGCILNIILDPIFIMPWGFGLGASGAGCATFISNSIAFLYYAIFLIAKRGKTFVCVHPKMAKPQKRIAKEIFGVGIPASIQNILNVIGMTILNNVTASYGNEAVSAMGIAHKVSMIPLYFSMGAAQGIMPLIGYNFSAKNKERMKATIRYTQKLFASFMVIATGIVYIFSAPIVALFMKNPTIVEYGSGFLRGLILAMPFLAFDFLGVAIFQACGMGRKSLVFAILRKIIFEIPAFLLLNRLFGMYGLGYGQLVAEFILAIAAAFEIEKILKSENGL